MKKNIGKVLYVVMVSIISHVAGYLVVRKLDQYLNSKEE